MTKKPQFDLLDQYNEQMEKGTEKALKLRDRAEKAKSKLAAANLERKRLVEASIDLEGAEEEKALQEIDELSDKIEKLQASYTQRQAEYAVHGRIKADKITREDVRKAFANEYNKRYHAEVTTPILEHIQELKVQLVAAEQELADARRYYESLKSEVWSTVGQDIQFDVFGSAYPNGYTRYLVTESTLHALDLKRVPEGVDKEAVEQARKDLQDKLAKEAK